MTDAAGLATQFEANRTRLRGVAYRLLGSVAEADDAVQETWLRLSRADASAVDNLAGWLTTVVGRVCLDALRARKARREEPLDASHDASAGAAAHRASSTQRQRDAPPTGASATNADPTTLRGHAVDPVHEAELAESVGLALLVVLETLEPAERLAFVLHDAFGLSFEEIAPIVERTPAAARQLASRARRRVRGDASAARAADPELADQRRLVDAFLAALRSGDIAALIAVLDPALVVTAELEPGVVREVRGAANWAKGAVAFAQLAQHVEPMLVNGAVGLVFAPHGEPKRVLTFAFADGKIASFDVIGDPARLAAFELAAL